MRAFEYTTPSTRQQAVELLSGEAAVLAGGTDLLSLMKDDVVAPKRVVNIKEIRELNGVHYGPRGMQIGALTSLGDLADHPLVKQHYPAFADALLEAASQQIRNMATIGGNICQRPRCWYFRSGFGLTPKTPEGKSLVEAGDNRYHAILGNEGPALFVSPSSIVPAMIAYEARIRIAGTKGSREVALEKFFKTPQAEGEREHDLQPNEIVTDILLPPSAGGRYAHYEVRQKDSFDWPLALAAVALHMNGDTVRSARVVMGYVAPVPWVSEEAAQALAGKSVTEETAKAAGDAAVSQAKPLSHNGYKVQLARVAVKRAILQAAKGKTKGGEA
ncbi:MAG TPA: xanthine dehydrogenase family protein subunit M [Terriglobales bacterium]|nr:xanthine dehydrogenase family protein subunit M [Terriglobales bacterium]